MQKDRSNSGHDFFIIYAFYKISIQKNEAAPHLIFHNKLSCHI